MKRLNTELGKKTAGAIVRYAEENHADTFFFQAETNVVIFSKTLHVESNTITVS